MKRLFLAMLALMLVTSTAYAFDAELSGNYYVRGTYTMLGNDADTENANYDHDLDISAKISTDENTYLKFAMESRDEMMNGGYGDTGGAGDIYINDHTVADPNTHSGYHTINQGQEAYIDYVYLGHVFGTGTTLEVGDMNDPLYWGTDFGPYASDTGFALQVTQAFSFGNIAFVTEKTDESNADLFEDDTDFYALQALINMGDMSFMPRIVYGRADESTSGDDDSTVVEFDLAFTGAWGKLSAEAEFVYMSTSDWGTGYASPATGDFDVFGLYAKVGYDFGSFYLGGLLAYGSTDDSGGFDYGDLTPLKIFGNDQDEDETGINLYGVTTAAILFTMNVNDKLALDAAMGYVFSNFDDGDVAWDDMQAIEVDFGATYSITDALSYNVNVAYAAITEADDNYDVDVLQFQHKLNLAF